MFTLFKSKPILKDLIPDNYIDIHSHLLPGIDDGAKTFEDSLGLIQALQKIGITQIITTPHIIQQFGRILKRKSLLIKRVPYSN